MKEHPVGYRQAPGIVLRRIAGEALLVPVKGKVADLQRIFVLNAVGEQIWNDLSGERTLAELVDSVTGRFDVAREAAETDVQEFVADLVASGLAVP